jgi:hypothetical protein
MSTRAVRWVATEVDKWLQRGGGGVADDDRARTADHRRAVRALARLDREAAVWVAHAAGALGADGILHALVEARPEDAGAIRGAAQLGRQDRTK